MHKIALVSPGYPPQRGGVEEFARGIAERLAKKMEVHVLALGKGFPAGKRGGVYVHRLVEKRIAGKRFAVWPKLRERIRLIAPDLVHVLSHGHGFAWQAAEAAKACRARLVVSTYGRIAEHNVGGLARSTVLDLFDATITPRIFGLADRVLYRAPELRQWCKGKGAGKVRLFPTAIDDAFFSAGKTVRKKDNKFVVGFVGAVSRRKGLDVLVEAMKLLEKEVPRAQLKVIGEAAEEEEAFKTALELTAGEGVEFVGRKEGTSLIKALDGLDAFCLPSKWEGVSQAMLQAMARGKPVVVTRLPGNEWAVGHNGLLVDYGDAAGLAGKLAWLAKNPREACAVGERGKEAAKAFSLDARAKELEDVYRELLEVGFRAGPTELAEV